MKNEVYMIQGIENCLFMYLPLAAQLRDKWMEVGEQGNKTFPNLNATVHSLAHFMSDRATAILTLIQQGLLWDADILMRSYTEACYKIIFVCCGDAIENNAKTNEFWGDLGEITELTLSARAKAFIDAFGDSSVGHEWIKAQILSEEDENSLKTKWPNKPRQALKQKWSFFEMLKHIQTRLAPQGIKLDPASIMYEYGKQSNFVHADELSLRLIRDREKRNPHERDLLVAACAASIMTNILDSQVIALWCYTKAIGAVPFDMSDWLHNSKEFREEVIEINVQFQNTQADLRASIGLL